MRFAAAVGGGLVVAAGLFLPAQAVEINEQGAAALRDSLARYLPERLAKSGFISVAPASKRYEVVYDFSKLLEPVHSPDFSITGLKPLSMFAEPQDNNLWKVESNGKLDVTARYKIADIVNTVTYSIGSFSYGGLFDPAIAYFRSGEYRLNDLKVRSEAGPQRMDAGIGALISTFTVTDAANGALDVSGQGTMSSFAETIEAPNTPPLEIRGKTGRFDVSMPGLKLKELRDLVVFALEHGKQKKLASDQQAVLKTLVRKALPVAASLNEQVAFDDLEIGTPQGRIGLKQMSYGLKMTGLTEATAMELSMSAAEPDIPADMVPALYAPLVPDSAEIAVGLPGMNFAGAVNAFLDKADFSRNTPLSDEDNRAIGRMIFPDGAVSVEFRKIAARSAAYDVEIGGKMKAYPERKDKVMLDATVFARDYDKTIAYFQNAAKSEPKFNQVSLGLMMAKGFARTEPDGRQRWDVSISEDGAVRINGNVVKAADKAAQ